MITRMHHLLARLFLARNHRGVATARVALEKQIAQRRLPAYCLSRQPESTVTSSDIQATTTKRRGSEADRDTVRGNRSSGTMNERVNFHSRLILYGTFHTAGGAALRMNAPPARLTSST